MPTRKRKKNSRQRASQTHGWGAKKKHRGKGNKGGSGMSGTGKRADSRKPSIWKDTKYFGKYGFTSKGIKKEINTINVGQIETELARRNIKDSSIDLGKIGYNKLLGGGDLNSKLSITVEMASGKAVEKVKAAGGEVILKKEEQ